MDFAVPADHRLKIKQREKSDKYFARELKRTMEHESDGDTACGWDTWNNHQMIGKGTVKFANKRTSRDYPDY